MAKQTKDEIREARGFKKEADKCSNCIRFVGIKYESANCTEDGFKISSTNWCNKHERKEA